MYDHRKWTGTNSENKMFILFLMSSSRSIVPIPDSGRTSSTTTILTSTISSTSRTMRRIYIAGAINTIGASGNSLRDYCRCTFSAFSFIPSASSKVISSWSSVIVVQFRYKDSSFATKVLDFALINLLYLVLKIDRQPICTRRVVIASRG